MSKFTKQFMKIATIITNPHKIQALSVVQVIHYVKNQPKIL